MFTQGWLLLAWFLLAVGVATRHGFAFLLGLVVLGSAAASYLWDRYCLARVEYRRTFTPRRAFYGETVTFTMEVTNRKPLPLAWLEVVDELPQQLVPLHGRVIPSVRQRRHHLVNLFSVRWYERVRRHTTLRCDARGYFPLGPARLRSGDIFGFTVRGIDSEQVDHLLVYPRVVPLAALGLPALYPLGDVRRRHLLEDPTRIACTREHSPGDPLRALHWKATPRRQALRARQSEACALPVGRNAGVVTAVTDDPLGVGLARAADAGHATVVILIGDEVAPPDMAVATYRVPEARGWQVLDGIVPEMVR